LPLRESKLHHRYLLVEIVANIMRPEAGNSLQTLARLKKLINSIIYGRILREAFSSASAMTALLASH
jgi:hypothetical protein